MHVRWLAVGGFLFVLIAAGMWWTQQVVVQPTELAAKIGQWKLNLSYKSVQALPESVELNPEKVALGEQLFHDVRLSSDNSIGCFSCHGLDTGGVDNHVRSIGVGGAVGDINTPTVFNSGFNFVQFWDGRAATLEDQIDASINNPQEMASNWPQVIRKISQDTVYAEQFRKLYRDGITPTTLKDAIATFERSLVTPNSRFDKYLRGDMTALSAHEKRGFELFQSYGCSSCHQGVNLGGNMFEKMGLMGDYFADRGNLTEADNGRFNVDQLEQSMHEFKVPSLRNVARTAPYFHDGSVATLQHAIAVMAKYQLGRPMPNDDVNAIDSFLESLTGEYKGEPL